MEQLEKQRWQWAQNAAVVADALDDRVGREYGHKALLALIEQMTAMQEKLAARK